MKALLGAAALTALGLILGNVLVKVQSAIPGACEAQVTVHSPYVGGPAKRYLKAHPVPQCPGVVAGVPVEQTQSGIINGVAGPILADSPWSERLVTPGGKRITVTCGSVPGQRRKCDQPLPDLLSYQYVPLDGNVSAPGSLTIIPVSALTLASRRVPLPSPGGVVAAQQALKAYTRNTRTPVHARDCPLRSL